MLISSLFAEQKKQKVSEIKSGVEDAEGLVQIENFTLLIH